MNPVTLSALMPWCADSEDHPLLCVPRLIDGRWIATDGTSVAWCRAEEGAVDPMPKHHGPNCLQLLRDMEKEWPLVMDWRLKSAVNDVPENVFNACHDCLGIGFLRDEDGDGKPVGARLLIPCDTCDGTGRLQQRQIRFDFQGSERGISIRNILKIRPADHIAIADDHRKILVMSDRYRAMIMPMKLGGMARNAHVLPTKVDACGSVPAR